IARMQLRQERPVLNRERHDHCRHVTWDLLVPDPGGILSLINTFDDAAHFVNVAVLRRLHAIEQNSDSGGKNRRRQQSREGSFQFHKSIRRNLHQASPVKPAIQAPAIAMLVVSSTASPRSWGRFTVRNRSTGLAST